MPRYDFESVPSRRYPGNMRGSNAKRALYQAPKSSAEPGKHPSKTASIPQDAPVRTAMEGIARELSLKGRRQPSKAPLKAAYPFWLRQVKNHAVFKKNKFTKEHELQPVPAKKTSSKKSSARR